MVLQTCNDILFFHNIEKTELDTVLNRLEDYMLLYKNIGSPLVSKETENKEIINTNPNTNPINNIICIKQSEILVEKQSKKSEKPDMNTRIKKLKQEKENIINPFILPKQNDTLFWCLFIAKYGYSEYIQVDRNYGVKELEIKSKVVDYIKANSLKFKETNYKITKILIQEIMSELMTIQKDTSMFCLLAILIYFDMNIIMVEHTSRFLLEFQSNKTEITPTFLIERLENGRYHIKGEQMTVDEIRILKEERICLENFMKPIKPISCYKIYEIEDVLHKIGVLKEGAVEPKMKKNELYELMKENIKW